MDHLTIELGLGKDAPANAETIFFVGHIKCRNGWMVRNLGNREGYERDREIDR